MNLRTACILTLIISIISSCTKIESTDIGAGLIPPVDNINTFDTTLDVTSFNLFDSDSTYPLRADNLVLGRISNDPLFGKTTAIVNVQPKPGYFPFRFNGIYDSLKLDSIVLVLGYRGTYGDTNTTQNLRVYEISQSTPLADTSVYTTRRRFQYKSTVLGSAVVDPRKLLVDSILPNKEPVNKNQIRIRITDPSFLDRMFKDTALLDSSKAFNDRFAGFGIVPDTTSGTPNSLFIVNLSDTNTKVATYYSYRVSGDSVRRKTVGYWYLASNSGYSNNIIRNPAGAEYLNATSTTAADSVVYFETRPDAPFAKLKVPGFDNLPNCMVHRAELRIVQMPNAATGSMDQYFGPPSLFLSLYSNDSSRKFMLPGGDVQYSLQGVSNLADFGAFPIKVTTNGQPGVINYSFNISRYVQAVATRKIRNYDFVINAPFYDYIYANESFNTMIPIAGANVLNPLACGRVRVGGGSLSKTGPNAAYRMRVRIIYTRI